MKTGDRSGSLDGFRDLRSVMPPESLYDQQITRAHPPLEAGGSLWGREVDPETSQGEQSGASEKKLVSRGSGPEVVAQGTDVRTGKNRSRGPGPRPERVEPPWLIGQQPGLRSSGRRIHNTLPSFSLIHNLLSDRKVFPD